MSVMDSFLVLPAMFLKISLAIVLRETIFTLYTEPRVKWQAALDMCRGQGQELVRVTSQGEQDFLKSLGQFHGVWYSKIGDDIWSSLYDPSPGTPGAGYHWQQVHPAWCQPLGSWTNWLPSQPSTDPDHLCVKLVWSQPQGFSWTTENCGREWAVICRQEGEVCESYKEIPDSSIKTSDEEQRTEHRPSVEATGELCVQACTQEEKVNATTCYAAEWTPGMNTCILHIARAPLADADVISLPGTGTRLYLRSCFKSVLNETAFNTNKLWFDPVCSNASATGAESTTTTSTTITTAPPRTKSSTAAVTDTAEASPATSPPSTTVPLREKAAESAGSTTSATDPSTSLTTTSSRSLKIAKSENLNTATSEVVHSSTLETLSTSTAEVVHSSTLQTLNTAKIKAPKASLFGELNTTTPGRRAYVLCPCSTCSRNNASVMAEQRRVLSQLLKTLAVDHRNTTSYKRKYTSVPDQRRSAQTIGCLGVVVLVAVVAVIVGIDASGVWCGRPQRVEPDREGNRRAGKGE